MKFPLMGLIILFFLSACSNDPSVELPINGKQLLLAEFKSDDEITRFEYNIDSSLSKLFFTEDPISSDQNVTYSVKYLANKKVDELVGSNGTKIKISYGLNGIAKSEVFAGSTFVSTSEYTYSGSLVSSVLISFSAPYMPFLIYNYEFIYNNSNNVSKVTMSLHNQPQSVVNFQFDVKKNPFTAAGDLMLIFWQYANKNNIIRQENRDMTGDLIKLIETNYTYNSFGYPTIATIKITEPGMQPSTSQLVFTYK